MCLDCHKGLCMRQFEQSLCIVTEGIPREIPWIYFAKEDIIKRVYSKMQRNVRLAVYLAKSAKSIFSLLLERALANKHTRRISCTSVISVLERLLLKNICAFTQKKNTLIVPDLHQLRSHHVIHTVCVYIYFVKCVKRNFPGVLVIYDTR